MAEKKAPDLKKLSAEVSAHLELTRNQHSNPVPQPEPSYSYVMSQFDEVVRTPVEEDLNADPSSGGVDVDDWRDVKETVAVRAARKKQKEAAKPLQDITKSLPQEDDE